MVAGERPMGNFFVTARDPTGPGELM